MKKIIYTLLLVSAPLYAQQNSVYKCVDVNGSVSYLNVGMQTTHCQKTDLSDPSKGSGMLIRNEDGGAAKVQSSYTKTTLSSVPSNIPVIKTDEQKKKDAGRANILSKELQDEEEQLINVQKMLQNVISSKDEVQISKLKEMEGRHVKNIIALKRELKIKDEVKAPNEITSSIGKLETLVNTMVQNKSPKINVAQIESKDTALETSRQKVENFLNINRH